MTLSAISQQQSKAKREVQQAQNNTGLLQVMHIDAEAIYWETLGFSDIAALVRKIKRTEHDA